jgi:hypothetical protein
MGSLLTVTGLGQFERLGLLGRVRVIGTGVDLQLAEHLAAQGVLGEHAAHRAPDELGGLLGQQLRVGGGAQAAGVAAVAVGELVGGLVRGEDHLVGVDHDHVVARVDVGGEVGAVLAAQDGGHSRGEAAEDQAVGVDDVPAALDLGDLR